MRVFEAFYLSFSDLATKYAISLAPYNQPRRAQDLDAGHDLRARSNRIFDDSARLKISKQSFSVDAARLWNQAPDTVKMALTLGIAKSAIGLYVKSLPV